ncbi:nischarin-like, partial [Planoprotostelium fungivorum]
MRYHNAQEVEITSGQQKVTLTPRGIQFKGTTRAQLIDLQWLVSQVKRVKIESPSNGSDVEKSVTIDCNAFTTLEHLEIIRCKPWLIQDVERISSQCISFKIRHSLNCLSELLDLRTDKSVEEEQKTPHWKKIEHFDASFNNVPFIHQSTKQLENVVSLDLSHNLIVQISNLDNCYGLKTLNLSYNKIVSLHQINQLLGMVVILNLSNNKIKVTQGLEKCYSLEDINLCGNEIEEVTEILRLKTLPLIQQLSLLGNPIAHKNTYRSVLYAHFRPTLILDGQKAQIHELTLNNDQMLHAVIPSPVEDGYMRGGSDRSPASHGKKKHKKRVVDIDVMNQSTKDNSGIKMGNLDEEEEKEEALPKSLDFQREIEQMRTECGEQWLMSLPTLLKEKMNILPPDPLPPPPPPPPPPTDKPIPNRSTTLPGPLTQPPTQLLDSETEDAIETSDMMNDLLEVENILKRREGGEQPMRSPLVPGLYESTPVIQDDYGSGDEEHELNSEEIYAQVLNGSRFEDRILVLDNKMFRELDIITAQPVVRDQLRYLVSCKDEGLTEVEHYYWVQLEFRTSLLGDKERRTFRYKIDSQAKEQLFHIVRPILEENGK